jgi:hypothetical protein
MITILWKLKSIELEHRDGSDTMHALTLVLRWFTGTLGGGWTLKVMRQGTCVEWAVPHYAFVILICSLLIFLSPLLTLGMNHLENKNRLSYYWWLKIVTVASRRPARAMYVWRTRRTEACTYSGLPFLFRVVITLITLMSLPVLLSPVASCLLVLLDTWYLIQSSSHSYLSIVLIRPLRYGLFSRLYSALLTRTL